MPTAEEVIAGIRERVEADAKERISHEAEHAVDSLKAQLDSLQRSAKIALPVDILRVLREGGAVLSHDFDLSTHHGDCHVEMSIGGNGVPYDRLPSLKMPGKFRMTLIVDRLPE